MPEQPPRLLDRDTFREAVFARDGHKCVCCKEPAQDAHHIMERRLFRDPAERGGYFIENGASVCGPCHRKAEQTVLSTEEIREAAGITRVILPAHLYPDQRYDKWANTIEPDGTRREGELFRDESVQKVLREGGVLHLFRSGVRYPRTHHVPGSPGVTKDDRLLWDLGMLQAAPEVVQSVKMDGENTTIYADGTVHARSIDGHSHPSQAWVRNLAAKIAHELEPGMRICGENLYAVHSIRYERLESYFYLFSVWDANNRCLSWDDTELWAQALGVPTVPVIYRGPYDPARLEQAFATYSEEHEGEHEGWVVRTAEAFHYAEFAQAMGKWVRPNHVREAKHNWRTGWYPSEQTVNGLIERSRNR